MRRPLDHAFLTFHSAADGFNESQGVSVVVVVVVGVVAAAVADVVVVVVGGGVVVAGVGVTGTGLSIVPSKYPETPRNSAAM